MLRPWPRRHLLVAGAAGVALVAALVWLAVATWQYLEPADLPSLLGNTAPVAQATVAGLAALVGAGAGLAFSRQRRRFRAPASGASPPAMPSPAPSWST